jgi:hypothetical protein
MPPSEKPSREQLWVADNLTKLLGVSEDQAVELVEAAGFKAFVIHPEMGAVAAMQVSNSIRLVVADGVVGRVRAG